MNFHDVLAIQAAVISVKPSLRFRLWVSTAVGLVVGVLYLLLHFPPVGERFYEVFSLIDRSALAFADICYGGIGSKNTSLWLFLWVVVVLQWMLVGLLVGLLWAGVGAISPLRRRLLSAAAILAASLVAYCTWFLGVRDEVQRFSDPSSNYTVVVSSCRSERYVMRFPGQSGDAEGFVEIFDKSGQSMGRIPVGMIQFVHELRWTSSGADLSCIGEWDFKKRTCYYWSERQDRKIWVRR